MCPLSELERDSGMLPDAADDLAGSRRRALRGRRGSEKSEQGGTAM